MLDFLPPRLSSAVRHVNLNRLYELRLRADKPLCANIGGVFCFLGEHGEESAVHALRPTAQEVSDTLFAASGYSVYSVENQIKRGFVTGADGERIGIAGSYVYEGNALLSIHSVTSLCIRIPHAIEGCAEEIYRRCLREGMNSVILLSPPGDGKTTLLRDLSRLVSTRKGLNVLVSDERGELSAGDLGDTSDVVRFADKLTAFTAGIRAMRPDVIVTDELLPEDYLAVRRAVESGIYVFASAHLKRYEDVPEKLFGRYVILSGLGKIERICGADGTDVA
ncbi:MAG: hypothetical protein K2G44_05085 [Clostridia bacterium]|nr:hypothetical protein [Clostridia bacterium]